MVDLGENFYRTGYYNNDMLDKDRVMKHSFGGFIIAVGIRSSRISIGLTLKHYIVYHMQ